MLTVVILVAAVAEKIGFVSKMVAKKSLARESEALINQLWVASPCFGYHLLRKALGEFCDVSPQDYGIPSEQEYIDLYFSRKEFARSRPRVSTRHLPYFARLQFCGESCGVHWMVSPARTMHSSAVISQACVRMPDRQPYSRPD